MKGKIMIFSLAAFAAAGAFFFFKARSTGDNGETVREVSPRMGSIRATVSTTGSVLPRNRLELKPPVNGRVESILVKEGETVKKGQTLGWFSSTERAALLDAAQGQGEEKARYWQEVYKPIALIAPIDGDVIVATVQPGQAVTTADAVLVLSDKLIVRAQVDETDIGKIKEGQKAMISLDAYPDAAIQAVVDHIYHESKTVNNVTIYNVDLSPGDVPAFFRSGMNANIDFITDSRDNALLLPAEAVSGDDANTVVLVRGPDGRTLREKTVSVGMRDDRNVEITAGLTVDDTVFIKARKYELPKAASAGNPFLPSRRQGSGRR